jgi:hypothetical protein
VAADRRRTQAPPKAERLLERIAEAVKAGRYVVSDHAYERSRDRLVPIPHVEHVLLHGFHEARKDQFNVDYNAWRYAIRGKSPDRVPVRVVVTFAEDGLLVVTVINLDRGD